MTRTFEVKTAALEQIPLLIALMGPSGSGKTFSALRLASGIQRVSPGEIHVIDTEARRALHYADRFQFKHLVLAPPFSPLDYLAAIEHCVKQGARTLIIDSMTHEHTGAGGVLEMHEQELDRLSRGNDGRREAMNFPAWAKPKAQRTKLLDRMLQLSCNYILCFRAKEKVKLVAKKDRVQGEDPVRPLGFMPVAGEEYVYEMTLNCLLLPGSMGVPTWHSEEVGERMMIKLPEQFRALFAQRGPLSEDIGEALAKWAEGVKTALATLMAEMAAAKDDATLVAIGPKIEQAMKDGKVNSAERQTLKQAFRARREALKAAPAPTAVAAASPTAEPSNGIETGEAISDEQLARLNSLIDKLEIHEDGRGFTALGDIVGDTALDALTALQATNVENSLRSQLEAIESGNNQAPAQRALLKEGAQP